MELPMLQFWVKKQLEKCTETKINPSRSLSIVCFCVRESPDQDLWEFRKLFWRIYILKHELLAIAGGKKTG